VKLNKELRIHTIVAQFFCFFIMLSKLSQGEPKMPRKRGRPANQSRRKLQRMDNESNKDFWDAIKKNIESLEQEAENTADAAEDAGTIYDYEGMVLQIHQFMNRVYEKPIVKENADGKYMVVDKPTVQQFKTFWQFKKIEKPDIRTRSLMAFKSGLKKFNDLQPEGPIQWYNKDEEAKFCRYFTGARKDLSKKKQSGEVSSFHEGKQHLTVLEYIKLCEESLKDENVSGRNHAELHLFIVLCWCMLAREETCVSFNAKHLDWDGDSLLFSVSSSKRNYNESPDRYRVYPNPFLPQCCPVLAIALACACDPTLLSNQKRLFHFTQESGVLSFADNKKGKKKDSTSAIGRQFKNLCDKVFLFSP
jgi:hypothetical protein